MAESHSTVLRTASSTHWQHSPDIRLQADRNESAVAGARFQRIFFKPVPVRERSVKQQHHPIRPVGILLRPGVLPQRKIAQSGTGPFVSRIALWEPLIGTYLDYSLASEAKTNFGARYLYPGSAPGLRNALESNTSLQRSRVTLNWLKEEGASSNCSVILSVTPVENSHTSAAGASSRHSRRNIER